MRWALRHLSFVLLLLRSEQTFSLAISASPERQWSRAVAGEAPPQRAARLQGHREHQARQKARRLARLDSLLDCVDDALGSEWAPSSALAPACGVYDVAWSTLPSGCDPCMASAKMRPGTQRGERKRESISAMAWLLETRLLAQINSTAPTIVDAGCGTGSLLLPLAAIFPHVTFVGVDMKAGSLERLKKRAAEAGSDVASRVIAWHGRIEEYDQACDGLVSLHACGGASDSALSLAAERQVPFAVSPCCVGKLRRGPASSWLREIVQRKEDASSGGESAVFALMAAWADSEHVLAAAAAPSVQRAGGAPLSGASDTPDMEDDDAHAEVAKRTAAAHLVAAMRRRRCKTLVEVDRLMAVSELRASREGGSETAPRRYGELLRITGDAMATSAQTELLAGPVL